MTEASSPPIYPQYCFHLSPTIHQWCPLKAKDIEAFTTHPGFEGLLCSVAYIESYSHNADNPLCVKAKTYTSTATTR